MNTSYKVRARPVYPYFNINMFSRFAQPALPKLAPASLGQSFEGAVVRQLTEYDDGSYGVEIDLARPTHADALNEIVSVFVGAGFQVAEAEVTEWTSSWVEGCLLGAFGGGAIGGEVADAVGLLLGVLVGAFVGAVGGSLQRKVVRTLDAVVNYYVQGGWQFTVRQPQVVQVSPGLA